MAEGERKREREVGEEREGKEERKRRKRTRSWLPSYLRENGHRVGEGTKKRKRGRILKGNKRRKSRAYDKRKDVTKKKKKNNKRSRYR